MSETGAAQEDRDHPPYRDRAWQYEYLTPGEYALYAPVDREAEERVAQTAKSAYWQRRRWHALSRVPLLARVWWWWKEG